MKLVEVNVIFFLNTSESSVDLTLKNKSLRLLLTGGLGKSHVTEDVEKNLMFPATTLWLQQ